MAIKESKHINWQSLNIYLEDTVQIAMLDSYHLTGMHIINLYF